MSTDRSEVLVIGAGVAGLTTGVRLAESGFRVRIKAERRPEESTSAAAGAIWDPIYASHALVPEWSWRTFEVLSTMAAAGRSEVRLVYGMEASRKRIPSPAWARRLSGFRECDPRELPGGFASGWRYLAPIIDMPPYLRYLEDRLRAAGGAVQVGQVRSLEAALDEASIVINCTGIGARDLVPDPDVEPVRGQLVAVRNPGVTEFFAEHTDDLDEMTYLLPQGDVLVLGGSADKGEADPIADLEVARGIVDRCAGVVPAVATAEVLEYRTGIRPQRPEIRLERVDVGDAVLVHNYGHSGGGVSLSWGCADAVLAELARA